jgi:hypothetical protein
MGHETERQQQRGTLATLGNLWHPYAYFYGNLKFKFISQIFPKNMALKFNISKIKTGLNPTTKGPNFVFVIALKFGMGAIANEENELSTNKILDLWNVT